MDSALRFFHYTSPTYLPAIIKAGYIKFATAGIDKKEKPAVWLSTNPVWEHTATKIGMINGIPTQMTMEQQYKLVGLARIEVQRLDDFVSWKKFRHVSGVTEQSFLFMERLGKMKDANPDEWWAYFKVIERKDWLAVEVWDGKEWVSADNIVEGIKNLFDVSNN